MKSQIKIKLDDNNKVSIQAKGKPLNNIGILIGATAEYAKSVFPWIPKEKIAVILTEAIKEAVLKNTEKNEINI